MSSLSLKMEFGLRVFVSFASIVLNAVALGHGSFPRYWEEASPRRQFSHSYRSSAFSGEQYVLN